jgi:hypothetical protein
MLLTAALLHAAPKCLPHEALPRRLPPNFILAALSVVRVLNNFARSAVCACSAALSSVLYVQYVVRVLWDFLPLHCPRA